MKKAYLPNTLTGITLNNCPNIDINCFDGVSFSKISSISTDNNDLIRKVLYSSDKLGTVNLTNIKINLTGISDSAIVSDRLYKALINPGSSCSGEIILDKELT